MKDILLVLLYCGVLALGSDAWAQENSQPQEPGMNFSVPVFCTPYPTYTNQVGDLPEDNA